MKSSAKYLVVFLIFVVAAQAIAQGEYPFLLFGRNPFSDLSFLGAGARARGMGGAFYAVSDDPAAVSWNPAGLIQMDKEQISIALHRTRAGNEYSGNYSSPSGVFSGDVNQSVYELAYAGVVVPFELKGRQFVGSASVPSTVSEMRGRDFRDSLDFTHEINGRLSKGSVGFATKIWKEFSLGLAVNVYGHGYDRNGFVNYELSPPPFDTVFSYHPKIKSNFSGFNFTLGGMIKLEKLRLAAVFKSPFTESMPLKEELDVRLVTDQFINGVKNPFGNAALGVLYKTKSEWILPGILGLGASYQVNDNLLIAADFDYKPFSKAWVKMQSDLYDPNSGFVPVDLKWQDINQFRMGGEYKLRVNRYTIPLRAGYRNDPKPFENVDNLYAFVRESPFDLDLPALGGLTGIYFQGTGSQVKGNVISFGSGVAFGQVSFDVTWEFESYDYEERGVILTNDNLQEGPNNTIIYNSVSFSRTSDVSNNRVIFNFTGVF
jgi:long-subunit fatty acid transport protein